MGRWYLAIVLHFQEAASGSSLKDSDVDVFFKLMSRILRKVSVVSLCVYYGLPCVLVIWFLGGLWSDLRIGFLYCIWCILLGRLCFWFRNWCISGLGRSCLGWRLPCIFWRWLCNNDSRGFCKVLSCFPIVWWSD